MDKQIVVIYTYIQEHVETLKDMEKDLKEGLDLRCKNNRIILYTKNEEDYKTVFDKVKAAGVNFHTYTLEKNRPVSSILKGIPPNVTTEEIKKDLSDNGFTVIEVKQFTKKVEDENSKQKEIKMPIYCVKFAEGTKVADIKKVRKVCYCIVTWERNYSSKQITQCYKCQGFMHIAKNCYKKESCARCAGEHNTKSCTEEAEKIKCINCGKKHLANSSDCEVFKRATRNKFISNHLDRSINENENNLFSNNFEDNTRLNKMSTNRRASVNYSQAVRGNNINNKSPNDNKNRYNNESFSSIWDEIKIIFNVINIKKIKNVIFSTISKIKGCKDAISKITYFIEGVMEIFE